MRSLLLPSAAARRAEDPMHRAYRAALDAALKRIADGSYGVCAKCGVQIDPRRLKALPTAIHCIACAG